MPFMLAFYDDYDVKVTFVKMYINIVSDTIFFIDLIINFISATEIPG